MLVQPVFGRDVKREETRTVTVLIDDSASMQIADKQMSVEERVSLAQFYGIDAVKNRPALAAQFAQAAAIRLRLERMAAALEAPDGFAPTRKRPSLKNSRVNACRADSRRASGHRKAAA